MFFPETRLVAHLCDVFFNMFYSLEEIQVKNRISAMIPRSLVIALRGAGVGMTYELANIIYVFAIFYERANKGGSRAMGRNSFVRVHLTSPFLDHIS